MGSLTITLWYILTKQRRYLQQLMTYVESCLGDDLFVRPVYQRGEVINKAKSSAIIESILLGIKLPPLYIFKREDGVMEVIDGQQRLLSILGFIGKTFLDESGVPAKSAKHEFSLSNLQILPELNGMQFKELTDDYRDKILDFSLSLIIIEEKFNPAFDPIDLFIRLNSRPYPIKENSFEMWNSYVDKEIIDSIKELVNKYEAWFYVRKNNLRMHNEELLTMMVYLDHKSILGRGKEKELYHYLDIFERETTINVRIKQKSAVTKMLNEASLDINVKSSVLKSVKSIEAFIRKIRTILIDCDIEDSEKFLDDELTSLFNVNAKRYYTRKFKDFYALWYLVHFLNQEIVNKERVKIKLEVQTLFREMKVGQDDEVNPISDSAGFHHKVDSFRNKYSISSRKISLSREEKKALIAQQNNLCPLCEGPLFIQDDIEVDHIAPIALGGKDRFLNLQVAHKLCNRKKGTRTIQ